MKKALVTLTIGDKYIKHFQKYCKANWEKYADKYGYDILVIKDYIDDSAKGKSRSPSWQKCLILNHQDVNKYEKVVWLDSDIVINYKNAPDIFKYVLHGKVGAVDEYSILGRNIYFSLLDRRYKKWEKENINFIRNLYPSDYHKVYGLEKDLNNVVQTGMMVLSPEYHSEVMTNVYNKYEDKGGPEWNYEMRPLSYELQLNFDIEWIDYRFNLVWPVFQEFAYPFLKYSLLKKTMEKIGLKYFSKEIKKYVKVAYDNSYFLHFAGSQDFIKHTLD